MVVDDRQVVRLGEGQAVGAEIDAVLPVLAIEELLVVPLEFVVGSRG